MFVSANHPDTVGLVVLVRVDAAKNGGGATMEMFDSLVPGGMLYSSNCACVA
jgi:hypothetical protein